MYTDPTGHYEYTDFLYLPNDALVQIDKYTNDYNDTSYNYLPGDVKFKSKSLNELKAHQNANAVRTFYANYYPRDTEEFAEYYKKYESADCGWVFFPKYKSSSRLLRLPSGEEITADNIDKLANDPTVRKYFLDNYITNPYQPTETLYRMWFHQFYGYTKQEIKDMKFREGLDNMFFGAIETGAGALSVAYSGGAMAYVGGGYATIDGLSRMSGGLSQMINSGNNKGETWNFKKNFYNFVSPKYGDNLYFADQMVGLAIGLYDIGAIVYGKAASKIGNLSSKEIAINSFYKGTGKTFYTVQSETDAARLMNGGNPWPTAESRAALGEGVYAWGTKEEATNYLNLIQKRNPNAKIIEFTVSDANLANLKSLNIDSLPDAEIESFMSQYSKLWGGTPNHGLEYIQRGTNMGTEHFFDKSIIDLLKFK